MQSRVKSFEKRIQNEIEEITDLKLQPLTVNRIVTEKIDETFLVKKVSSYLFFLEDDFAESTTVSFCVIS